MDIFLLYLFTRVNTIIEVAGMVILFGALLCLPLGMIYGMGRDSYSWEDAEKKKQNMDFALGALKWLKRIALIVIPCALVVKIIVPTQKDLAIIVGGKLAIEAVQSETAKKVYTIVQNLLDEQLEDIAKKKAK